jgi:hypothetical protein
VHTWSKYNQHAAPSKQIWEDLSKIYPQEQELKDPANSAALVGHIKKACKKQKIIECPYGPQICKYLTEDVGTDLKKAILGELCCAHFYF